MLGSIVLRSRFARPFGKFPNRNKFYEFAPLCRWASFGFPDLVGYTEKQGFFTVELKVTKSKKIALSPHQIAFHVKHPTNTWILAATLDPRSNKLYEYFLVPGSMVRELAACGLADREPVPCASLERLLLVP